MLKTEKWLIRRNVFYACKDILFPNGKVPQLQPAGRTELLKAGMVHPSFANNLADYGYFEVGDTGFVFDPELPGTGNMWPIDEGKVLAILIERDFDTGCTKADYDAIFDEFRHLGFSDEEEYETLYLEAEHSWAFGLMVSCAADEVLNFMIHQDSTFAREAIQIMEDMELETEDQRYIFAGIGTHLHR